MHFHVEVGADLSSGQSSSIQRLLGMSKHAHGPKDWDPSQERGRQYISKLRIEKDRTKQAEEEVVTDAVSGLRCKLNEEGEFSIV